MPGPTNPAATPYYGARTLRAGSEIVGRRADQLDPSVGVTPFRRRVDSAAAMVEGVYEGLSPSYMWRYWTGRAGR